MLTQVFLALDLLAQTPTNTSLPIGDGSSRAGSGRPGVAENEAAPAAQDPDQLAEVEAALAKKKTALKDAHEALRAAEAELKGSPTAASGSGAAADRQRALEMKVAAARRAVAATEAAVQAHELARKRLTAKVSNSRAYREVKIKERYTDGGLNSAPGKALEGVLQVLGQVVVDKAVESGWQLLAERLEKLAHCPKPGGEAAQGGADARAPFLKNTCAVLETDIHDLIAQPDILVQAAILDLLQQDPADAKLFGTFKVDWKGLRAAWRADRTSGVAGYLTTSFQSFVIETYSKNAACPAGEDLTASAAWMIGHCLVDGLARCDIDALATQCVITDVETRQRVIAAVAASAGGQKPRDAVNALFELERLRFAPSATGVNAYLGHLQGLVVGLLDEDTNRAMAAAAALAGLLIERFVDDQIAAEERDRKATNKKPLPEGAAADARTRRLTAARESTRKFFEVLAGAARYATVKGTDAEKLAARKEVVKELITRLTRRRNRSSGMVASLGGSFGLVGGARAATGGPLRFAPASVLHVGLGVGLDSYHSHQKAGFHAEISALDLGQYVVFANNSLTVEKPDLKAAIAPSLKVGMHFGLKETPMYLAGFLGLSPFIRENKTAQEHMTLSFGLMFGVYVPFIDLN